MRSLPFGGPPFERVLLLGAHPDDIEIGAGGTVLRLVESFPDAEFVWVVLAAHGERAAEAHASAHAFLSGTTKSTVVLREFRDGFLPHEGAAVKEWFEEMKASFTPDLVITHHRHDLHQDHRLVAELSWNTWRSHLLLEYEIPKYDADLGAPNVFVELDEPTIHRKVALLKQHFPSQLGRRWFDDDLFLGLARIRGMESGGPSRYAEAFYGRKILLDPSSP